MTDWKTIEESLVYEKQGDAVRLFNRLAGIMTAHNQVRIIDILDVIDQTSEDWDDYNYGWTDMTGWMIRENESAISGWFLDIPEPKPLENADKVKENLDQGWNDMVNHPPHYTQGGLECIDAMEAMLGDEDRGPFEGYLCGQVLKYLWRYPYKNGQEDLKKARWYLDRLIGLYDSQKG